MKATDRFGTAIVHISASMSVRTQTAYTGVQALVHSAAPVSAAVAPPCFAWTEPCLDSAPE